jgi:hypothetical protein
VEYYTLLFEKILETVQNVSSGKSQKNKENPNLITSEMSLNFEILKVKILKIS